MTPSSIPFNDLARGTRALRASLDSAIGEVLDSGWFVLGPQHDAFEDELATFLGCSFVLGVGNGTDALQIALTALGVGPGDTVLTAANAGGYTFTAARSLGAVPVYADVDPASLLLTADSLELALEGLPTKPSAIVVTHLFGAVTDIHSIVRRAREWGIPVVEDCAQSLGAFASDVRAGTVGDIATTSFYPTKNLGAVGDGGAVMTSNRDLADAVRQLRQYGWKSKYRTTVVGGRNSRLDELQAAVLRVKLPYLDKWNDRRRELHRLYESAAGGNIRCINTAGPGYSGHLAVFDVADRPAAIAAFAEAGIQTDIHYPIPDHLQPVNDSGSPVSLAVTERAAERILSVPLFPDLTDDEAHRAANVLSSLR